MLNSNFLLKDNHKSNYPQIGSWSHALDAFIFSINYFSKTLRVYGGLFWRILWSIWWQLVLLSLTFFDSIFRWSLLQHKWVPHKWEMLSAVYDVLFDYIFIIYFRLNFMKAANWYPKKTFFCFFEIRPSLDFKSKHLLSEIKPSFSESDGNNSPYISSRSLS